MDIKKGDMFYADLGHENIKNSEQYGTRPVVIISNETDSYSEEKEIEDKIHEILDEYCCKIISNV